MTPDAPTSFSSPPTGGVRYAPSPTGRFHLGNLRTAYVSHALARMFGLPWVVRFEDIDRPRVLPGALGAQLEDLAALGLKPDHVLLQSVFHPRHLDLFENAVRAGAVYACDCSRKDVQTALAAIASAPHDGGASAIYSGHCRNASPARVLHAQDSLAWRFRMPDSSGRDDFIVARSGVSLDSRGLPPRDSFVPAYHWACAIDDFDGGHELLVRAWDLENAAVPQRAIRDWLRSSVTGRAAPEPALFHTSLVVSDDGHRLEKRTLGVTLQEVLARGCSTQEIAAVFEKSFDLESARLALDGFSTDAGETLKILPLKSLGFS